MANSIIKSRNFYSKKNKINSRQIVLIILRSNSICLYLYIWYIKSIICSVWGFKCKWYKLISQATEIIAYLNNIKIINNQIEYIWKILTHNTWYDIHFVGIWQKIFIAFPLQRFFSTECNILINYFLWISCLSTTLSKHLHGKIHKNTKKFT